jgi:Xaa-Pro aminopeptidase
VLSPISKDRLAVGNVVTDEPGIYIPGFGGVRIEDSVLVKQRVPEKFTDGFYSLKTAR